MLLFILFTLSLSISTVLSVGGIAELKGLTGDAPYLGFGNQEQAPEYFGEAAYRQYYSNPAYGYAPAYGQGGNYGGFRSPYRGYGISKYQQNAMNSYPGPGFGAGPAFNGLGGIGGLGGSGPPGLATGPVGNVGLGSALGGGVYHGGGNEWVVQKN
uniref:Uncharacterized protein n=1 Tax=Ditylenchus dipsaci TaxID=166011 RepID=A0A915DD94_9BILA